MEFLIGRSLLNAMVNLGMDSECEEALTEVTTILCVVFLCTVKRRGSKMNKCKRERKQF